MLEILFDANHICENDLKIHKNLIYRILFNELKPPNIKMMKGLSYHDKPVFRAKINDKERLIYTYLNYNGKKTLCILAKNDHNYERLKRQLKANNLSQIDTIQLQNDENTLLSIEPMQSIPDLKFLPAVAHKKSMVVWDEQQEQCHLYKDSIIFFGPPGAGKTLVLYNNMLRTLSASQAKTQLPILFISQSKNLLNLLRADFQTLDLNFQVNFITWLEFLKFVYPNKKAVSEEDFNHWLIDLNWKAKPREVHYELSLIVALGEKKYLQLGSRQCHFVHEKTKLIQLVKDWRNHLNKNNFFDPLISIPNEIKQSYFAIFSDETQNLPPAALSFLIKLSKQYIVSIDSEQCLFSSPYIHNCLKELFYNHFKHYEEIQLAKTWRCPPEIIAAGNHLMNAKHAIDGGKNRRDYKEVESTLPKGSGNISWIDEQHLSMLKDLCLSKETVVIAQEITEELRKTINETLGTNHILTPKKAIGQEFENVILWSPFSEQECFRELAKRKQLEGSGLSIEQWNAINSIYVSLTRAQKTAYIYDDLARKRLNTLPQFLLGELPLNQFNKTEKIEQPKNQWLPLVKNYMDEGDYDTARQLMSYHLGYKDSDIDQIIKASLPKEVKTTRTTSSTTSKLQISNPKPAQNAEPQKPKKNQFSAEQKRIEEFYARFSQQKLLELFKEKDGMELLFKFPTANYSCLFARCMEDKAKYNSFIKFIKENGKLAAEKLTPKRLIETRINSNNPKGSLIPYLYQINKEAFLHSLLKQYKAAQRIIFICESYIYSPDNLYVKTDHQLQFLLNFDDKAIEQSKEELIDLLCQSTLYSGTSYLYHIADHLFGLSLVTKLINNKKLADYLYTNLYVVAPKNETSLFYKFIKHTDGINFFTRLFKNNPLLLKQLSIDDLFAKNPKDKPTVFNYLFNSEYAEYHSFLNLIITAEIAAVLPHELPDIRTLALLSSKSVGVEIIKRMLVSQKEMVNQMTGKIITQAINSTGISIFSLLCMSQEGPIILNRLLNHQGKALVDDLSFNSLFNPIYHNDARNAFDYLMTTEEGERFLSGRLRHAKSDINLLLILYARENFPLSSKCAFFATSKKTYERSKPYHPKLIDILLWHLYKGNEEQVKKIIFTRPKTLLEKGCLIEESGKSYNNILPLVYCSDPNRSHFCELMINALQDKDNEEAQRVLKSFMIPKNKEIEESKYLSL